MILLDRVFPPTGWSERLHFDDDEVVEMANRRGAGRRKVGRKKRRMRAKIRHRK